MNLKFKKLHQSHYPSPRQVTQAWDSLNPPQPIEKSNAHKQHPTVPTRTKVNLMMYSHTWLFVLEILSAKLRTQEVYWSIIHSNTYWEGATKVLDNWNTTDDLSTNFWLFEHMQWHPWHLQFENTQEEQIFHCEYSTCSFSLGGSAPKCHKHI